jgi:fumarate hydratase class II
LNVLLPLIAHALLQQQELVAGSARALAQSVIPGLRVNAGQVAATLARNPMLLTALAPRIGYDRAAAIAKRAAAENRAVLEVAVEETGLPRAELAELLDPARLARGGGGHVR